MKYIIFVLLIGAAVHSSAVNDNSRRVDLLLDRIGIESFIKSIQKIQEYNSIEEIDEVDYKLKKFYHHTSFWKSFNVDDYEVQLIQRLGHNFSARELDKLLKGFSKPFMSKVLAKLTFDRDLFRFYKKLIDTDSFSARLSKKKKNVLKSTYNLAGLSIQEKTIEAKLGLALSSTQLVNNLVNSGLEKSSKLQIVQSILDRRRRNLDSYLLRLLADDLKEFDLYELGEFNRVMKSELYQKFLQFYVNYHFIYMTKYIYKTEES